MSPPPRSVRHLPIFPIPLLPQKEDYHNLKYAKFVPSPEFTKYYSSYVGLAALKAVPQLTQIFNNNEQLIWKYMQKKSIEFNTYNKEEDFASRLVFDVLSEQIMKNIMVDFNIRGIKFKSLIDKELLLLLNKKYDGVKDITKASYKRMYDKIVLKILG